MLYNKEIKTSIKSWIMFEKFAQNYLIQTKGLVKIIHRDEHRSEKKSKKLFLKKTFDE